MAFSITTITKIIRPVAVAGGLALAARYLLKRKSEKTISEKSFTSADRYVPDDFAYHRWMS